MYIIHFMVNQMAAAIILMGNNIKQCVQRTHQINSMRFNTLNQGAVNSTKSYKISAVLSVLTLYNWTLRSLTCFTPTVLAQMKNIKLELCTFLPPAQNSLQLIFTMKDLCSSLINSIWLPTTLFPASMRCCHIQSIRFTHSYWLR